MINKTGLKTAIKAYENKINGEISKDKIKTDLKNIFAEHQVDSTNFYTISLDANSGASITNYIDRLADKIYKKSQKKNQTTAEKNETDEKNAEDSYDDNTDKNPSKPKEITISNRELLQWSEDEIKPQLTNKLLKAGFTMEELNSPDDSKVTYNGIKGSTQFNVAENTPLIDRFVETFKMLKRALESGKNIEDALREMNDESMKKDVETPVNKDDNQSQFANTSEQNEESSQDNSDKLTTEDLDDIMNYGIEGMTTHSEMVEFRNSEEWKQIQSMQENALSRFDGE